MQHWQTDSDLAGLREPGRWKHCLRTNARNAWRCKDTTTNRTRQDWVWFLSAANVNKLASQPGSDAASLEGVSFSPARIRDRLS
jgi:hypothetical protein